MFRRVKKRYPGPQEEKMTVRPGFLQKTGLAEEKICSGPVLHRKSTILTGKMRKTGLKQGKSSVGSVLQLLRGLFAVIPGVMPNLFLKVRLKYDRFS